MRRNKDFLRNIKKLTALVLAAAAIVTAYNIPIDKTRTITGFMQTEEKLQRKEPSQGWNS